MNIRYTLRAALMASTCLLPLVSAHADDFDVGSAAPAQKAAPVLDNSIEAGSLYTSSRSFKFGQYTGDTKNGGTGIGDFLVRGRDAWDSGTTTFWELTGDNLGLDSRSASFKYGEQGKWSAKVYYDGVPYWQSNSFHTVFDTSGTGALAGGLTRGGTFAPVTPQQWPACTNNVAVSSATCTQAPLATAASMANWPSVAGQLSVQDVKTQRDRVGGDFDYKFGNWSLTGKLYHEHKEGTKENSLTFSSNGIPVPNAASTSFTVAGKVYYSPLNTTNMMYFPEPVNYDTDRYSASAAYNTRRLQASVTYTFNKFTDNQSTFNAQDPFQTVQSSVSAAGAALTGPYTGAVPNFVSSSLITGANPTGTGPYYIPLTAAYSLPPSSSAHTIKAQAGYNLDPATATRVVGTFQYGLMYQDEAFVSPTNTTQLLANQPSQSVYGTSLNGEIQTYTGKIQVTSRPLPKLNLLASYGFDVRDNNTPVHSVAYSLNGAAPSGPFVSDGQNTDGTAVTRSVPYAFTKQTAKVEAGYNILSETKITVSDTYSIKDSRYLAIDRNNENAATARVNSQLASNLEGSLGATHSVRTGTYTFLNANWAALNPYGTAESEANLVPYSEASRTRDELKGEVGWAPMDNLGLDLSASFANDRYPSFELGVKSDHQVQVSPSISYRPNKNTAYNLFYSFEEIYQGAKFATNPGIPNGLVTSTAISSVPWFSNTTDTVHTVGAAANWNPVEKLKIRAAYNFSYGATQYLVADGLSGIPFSNNPSNVNYANLTPLPDTKNTLNQFQLTGEYKYNDSMSIWTGYTFQKLNSSDWVYPQTAVSPYYYSYVLAGDANPSYTVHTVGAALRVKW